MDFATAAVLKTRELADLRTRYAHLQLAHDSEKRWRRFHKFMLLFTWIGIGYYFFPTPEPAYDMADPIPSIFP